jgi:dihydroxy-acid dehydratase
MATVCEVLGISPFGSASVPATDADKANVAHDAGALLMDVLKRGLKPRQILTRNALENAIAAVAATGGSTNAVLHLLAIANEAGVKLDIDDFDRISARVPLLADLKPGGTYVATDLYRAGGIPLVARRLFEGGFLHADAITVSGRSIGEHAREAKETPQQTVVRPLSNPLKPTGGLVILKGNLAPDGAVVKVAGGDYGLHVGPARVFDSEELAFAAVKNGGIRAGDVVDIRFEGDHGRRPRRFGGDGHRRPFLRRDPRVDGRPRRA